jgi:ankyrin repeat protein
MSSILDSKHLWEAVGDGEHDEAQRLVKAGANAKFRDKYGSTPLHQASNNGDLRALPFLVDN